MPFLSNPETFKFSEDLIDWSEAPKGLSPSQHGWVWTQEQFTAALSFTALKAIETEVDRLSSKGKAVSKPTSKTWALVQEIYKAHPEMEPAYIRPFYDGLHNISIELSQLYWEQTLSYDYQKFVKHTRGLNPNAHIYGNDNFAVSELKVLSDAISLLDGSQSKAINLKAFDNFEEKIYSKLLDTIAGSRLWA